MSKRIPRPIFFHDGFLFRHVKTLADGSELLYCDKRQTIGCTASAKRINNHIYIRSGHTMHEADTAVASAKLARYTVKKVAAETTCPPQQLLKEFGSLPLTGSRHSLTKMIYRARQSAPESRPSTSGAQPEPMDGFNEFPAPQLNVQEALQQLVREDVVDPEEEPNFPQYQEEEKETITLPRDTFFEDIRDVIRETVKETQRDMVAEITSEVRRVVASETKKAPTIINPSFELNECVKNFLVNLQNLGSGSISDDLMYRTQMALNNLESKTVDINMEKVLDATLRSLEG